MSLLRNKFITKGIELSCATIIGIILAIPAWSKFWVLLPLIAIFVLYFFEWKVDLTEKHLKVEAQLRLFITLCAFENVLNVRCTYHVPIWRNKYLQTFDYLPCGSGSNRQFPQKKGLVGKAIMRKCPLVENFESDEDYRRRMVREYNFTIEELQLRTADRRSYFCYPIVDEANRVHGVIYFDSSQINTFTLDKNNARMQTIFEACEQIKNSLL